MHTSCDRFIKIQEDESQGQHIEAWASLFYRFPFNVIISKGHFSYPVINFQKTISLKKIRIRSNMGFWHRVMQYTTVILSHVGYKDHKFTGQHGHGEAEWGSFTCGCTSATRCYIAAFALNITVPFDTALKMTKVFPLDNSFWLGFLVWNSFSYWI